MTLLFVNTLYHPDQMGGAEVSVQLLCEALYRKGHKVFVLSLGKENRVKRLNGVVTISLVTRNLYPVTLRKKVPWQQVAWHLIDTFNLSYYFTIRRLLKRIHPHLINTNNLQGFSLFAWKAMKDRHVPLLHTLRDYYILCHRNTLYKDGCQCGQLCMSCSAAFMVKKRLCDLPDGFIGISQHIINRHRQYHLGDDRPFWTLPNIQPAVKKSADFSAVDADNIRIGFLGRVTAEKGVPFLLDEMSRLKERNYTLLLAGEYDEQFKKKLELQYPLKGRLVFAGVIAPAAFFSRVDMVVMPSAWEEPFGRVVIEALAYNKPVCVAERGGLVDLFEQDCMWQFQMRSGSLTPVLTGILQHPEVIEQKARECYRFLSKYSEEHIAELFGNIAMKMINKKRHE